MNPADAEGYPSGRKGAVLKTNSLTGENEAKTRMDTGFLFLPSEGGKKFLSYFLSFFLNFDGS